MRSRRLLLSAAVLYSAGCLMSAVMSVLGWLPPALGIAQFVVLGVIAWHKWSRLDRLGGW